MKPVRLERNPAEQVVERGEELPAHLGRDEAERAMYLPAPAELMKLGTVGRQALQVAEQAATLRAGAPREGAAPRVPGIRVQAAPAAGA